MTYSTHTIHPEPTDSFTLGRHATGNMLALSVTDADGRTVARVELLGRPDQLDPVTLAPAVEAAP